MLHCVPGLTTDLSLYWTTWIQSTLSHPVFVKSILILSTHLCLGLPSRLFPSDFPTESCTRVPHAQPISSSSILDHFVNSLWSVPITTLSLYSCTHPAVVFSPSLVPRYSTLCFVHGHLYLVFAQCVMLSFLSAQGKRLVGSRENNHNSPLRIKAS